MAAMAELKLMVYNCPALRSLRPLRLNVRRKVWRFDLLHAPDLPIDETHFYAVRMLRRGGQNLFYYADGASPTALIFLAYDRNA
jgi:hypothetical protein